MEKIYLISGGEFFLLGFSCQPQFVVNHFVIVLVSSHSHWQNSHHPSLLSGLQTPHPYLFLTHKPLLSWNCPPAIVEPNGTSQEHHITGCTMQLYVSLFLGSTEYVSLVSWHLTSLWLCADLLFLQGLSRNTVSVQCWCKAMGICGSISGVPLLWDQLSHLHPTKVIPWP